MIEFPPKSATILTARNSPEGIVSSDLQLVEYTSCSQDGRESFLRYPCLFRIGNFSPDVLQVGVMFMYQGRLTRESIARAI